MTERETREHFYLLVQSCTITIFCKNIMSPLPTSNILSTLMLDFFRPIVFVSQCIFSCH